MSDGFRVRGVNHLALVCRDMAATMAFYEGVLGMPLIKTIELGGGEQRSGGGQHFFFDCGNGDSIAFFWFADSPPAAPGVASPAAMPGEGDFRTAHGSMNHVAFDVDPDDIDGYVQRLRDAGVACTEVMNHDDSVWGVASRPDGPDSTVFVRSIYFMDPDGIQLEFAAWTRSLGPDDVSHTPAQASD